MNGLEALRVIRDHYSDTEDAGEKARITAPDTELRIPPNRLEAIFEDLKTTKPRELGLGLTVSRKSSNN